MIWSAAIASEFTANRALALAVAMIGSGIGAIVAPIVAGSLITAFDWRVAYMVMGLGWGGLAGLFCLFFFRCRLDQKAATAKPGQKAAQDLPGLSAREALTSWRFARFLATILIGNTIYVGMYVHMIPLLVGTGLPREEAAWIVGLGGFASIGGQAICGVLADRLPGRFISAVSVSLLAVASILLLIPTDSLALRVIPVLCVATVGGERIHMLSYLTTRYFGLKAFGTIFGVVASTMAIPVGLGPLLAGFIYDRTGSYDALLIAGIPVGIITALLTLSLGRYPTFPKA
jgi:predicted MFS family arabinose efflux permease